MKMILIIMSILMVSHSHATETGLLMNAKKAIPSDYPEVVLISSSVGQCTASIIGPHVLVSAGHCALTGKSVEFTFKGKKMKAMMTVSHLYDGVGAYLGDPGLDLSLGYIKTKITGIDYASVGGSPAVGDSVTMLGYGCNRSYKNGSKTVYSYDDKLRVGKSEITDVNGYMLVLEMNNGAYTCMGDSGGPTYDVSTGKRVLVGVHSLADLESMSFEASTSTSDAMSFFKTFISDHNVDICGVNITC